MSSRKRTKRKNSEEDFDIDEEDDDLDNDDTNKWACHSCTFMNRAAAYRCFVCGTRKGTSTRRSLVNDNVVEMQKTITTMVQKQVEKEKSMKRRERSLMDSVPRETSAGPKQDISLEIKQEMLLEYEECNKKSTSATPVPVVQKPPTPEVAPTPIPTTTEAKVQTPDKPAAPVHVQKRKYVKKSSLEKAEKTPNKGKIEKGSRKNSLVNGVQLQSQPIEETKPSKETLMIPSSHMTLETVAPPCLNQQMLPKEEEPTIIIKMESVPITPVQPTVPSSVTIPVVQPLNGSIDHSILQHLPERVVKKLNQPNMMDQSLLSVHKRLTGIDPIVAESEAVLLPQDWTMQRVMRGLTQSAIYASPSTSRQSSETDSSSSEANKSLDAPLHDISPRPSRSCQIPDYMIHRDSPQKIFIVANGFPAYFEEFPRRIPPAHP